jgi:hypothetical protein
MGNPDIEPTFPIPEPEEGATYPGDIQPGYYNLAELVGLLRDNANNPDAIYFIADMLEP